MRLVFAGTPAVAIPTLEALVAAGHEISAVITREDAPTGRRRILTPSPVAARAEELGLSVIRANRLDDGVAARVLETGPELGVVVAYGGLIREPLLHGPRHGWINLHFSRLPQWRGAAPVQRAVLNADTETGISVFELEAGLDTGPTYVNRAVPLAPFETSGAVLERLAAEGAGDVVATVAALAAGTATAVPQHGTPTHAAKLTGADGRIDWSDSLERVRARILGATPEPGATTIWRGGRLKILEIEAANEVNPGAGEIERHDGQIVVGTADGVLGLVRVQPAGKPAMSAGDWWRGLRSERERFTGDAT